MILVKDINDVFPKFVPDQLLTSDDLNNLFNYLDQQERMTRTNLIGIGIVCGLNAKQNSSGTEITISRGCGVTSKGYLINMDTTVYDQYTMYDALVQDDYEHVFVDVSSETPVQRVDLWELHASGVTPGTPDEEAPQPLSTLDLSDKVVLLFVELLDSENRNCDPSNCDDRGANTRLAFKPLLIRASDIHKISVSNDEAVSGHYFEVLDDLAMRRWNVPASELITTADILNSYKNILSPAFILRVRQVLSRAYDTLRPAVAESYPSNPFANLHTAFQFLHSGVTAAQVMHMQYYYDFFGDVVEAYRELRVKGMEILSECCPDEDLFPRHLLLGELQPDPTGVRLQHRHHFIYSPLYSNKSPLAELKLLFRRIVAMISNLQLPAPGSELRVTPSLLDNSWLSKKAIPYYYNAPNLYRYWNFQLSRHGKGNQNLSYHAASYNNPPTSLNEPYRQPLLYDLEPYNFLRIEGIINKDYKEALTAVQNLIAQRRLPIDVIALRSGDSTQGLEPVVDDGCDQNLEISYDIARREWEAIIGKTIEYLDNVWSDAISIVNSNSLTSFKKNLHKGKKFMVDDLPGFLTRYEEFIEVYETIEAGATSLRNAITGVLSPETIVRELHEDLVDHLDSVVTSCKKGPFRALYQASANRTPEALAKMLFHNYAKEHPGLQHKAGVTMGGTFVMVYHYDDEADENAKGPFVISGEVMNAQGETLPGVVVLVQGTSLATVTDAAGRYHLTVPALPVTLRSDAIGIGTGYLTVVSSATPGGTILVPGNSSTSHNPGVFRSIQNNRVIADFYLPYRCCSSCAPIKIVIREQPPPEEPEVITCGELADIVQQFADFSEKYMETIERLRFIFQSYAEVEEYLTRLEEVATFSTEQQLTFFIETQTDQLIVMWLKELSDHIRNPEHEFLRETGLALFRLLTNLAFYISCIQRTDIHGNGEARLPMQPVLEFIHETLRSFLPFGMNMRAEEILQIRLLRDEVRRQIEKIETNEEESVKPAYLEILNRFLDTLNEFPLGN